MLGKFNFESPSAFFYLCHWTGADQRVSPRKAYAKEQAEWPGSRMSGREARLSRPEAVGFDQGSRRHQYPFDISIEPSIRRARDRHRRKSEREPSKPRIKKKKKKKKMGANIIGTPTRTDRQTDSSREHNTRRLMGNPVVAAAWLAIELSDRKLQRMPIILSCVCIRPSLALSPLLYASPSSLPSSESSTSSPKHLKRNTNILKK